MEKLCQQVNKALDSLVFLSELGFNEGPRLNEIHPWIKKEASSSVCICVHLARKSAYIVT